MKKIVKKKKKSLSYSFLKVKEQRLQRPKHLDCRHVSFCFELGIFTEESVGV